MNINKINCSIWISPPQTTGDCSPWAWPAFPRELSTGTYLSSHQRDLSYLLHPWNPNSEYMASLHQDQTHEPVHVLFAHLFKVVDKARNCLGCRQEKRRATFPRPALKVLWEDQDEKVRKKLFKFFLPKTPTRNVSCWMIKLYLWYVKYRSKLEHTMLGTNLLTSPPNLSFSYPGSLWYGLSVIRDCR